MCWHWSNIQQITAPQDRSSFSKPQKPSRLVNWSGISSSAQVFGTIIPDNSKPFKTILWGNSNPFEPFSSTKTTLSHSDSYLINKSYLFGQFSKTTQTYLESSPKQLKPIYFGQFSTPACGNTFRQAMWAHSQRLPGTLSAAWESVWSQKWLPHSAALSNGCV